MPNAYILNQVPASYGAAMSLIAEMLVGAGWTYKASGDGLAGYSATGKVFTGSGSGALGWGNAKAWARLADPAGGREIILQTNASTGVRMKYSFAAHFIGGAPSAVVTPSAADERPLWGGGTDAVPTYNTWFGAGVATATNKFHGAAMGDAPYGFWVCGSAMPAGAIQCGLMLDPVSSVPEDIDPVIFYIGAVNAFGPLGWGTMSFTPPGVAQLGCFGHRDAAATLFEQWSPTGYNTGGINNNGSSYNSDFCWRSGWQGGVANAFNGKYDALPIPYIRPPSGTSAVGPGLKGWSTMTRWPNYARIHAIDTMDAKQWIAIGVLWLRWDGVTQPTN